MIWLVFSALFVVFRTQNYTAVDGALRCVQVYHRQQIFFHDNRHLLYPVNVFAWQRLLQVLGIQASNAVEFIGLTQIMNGLAAAGCVAILYWLTHSATRSVRISLAVALGLGFSRAFLLHATNSAEPMMGLFWSFVAVQVAVNALQKNWKILLAFSGVFLSLAMATYQSMVLVGPAIAILCLLWSSAEPRISVRLVQLSYTRLLYFIGGAAIGVSLIYGWAYSHSGTHGLTAMVDRFFSVPHVTGITGLEVRKIINLPLGMVGNLLPVLPTDFAGIRSLVREHRHDLWIPWLMLMVSGFLVFLAVNISQAWKAKDRLGRNDKVLLIGAVSAVVAALAGPLYVEPIYDKLWLLPLACLFFLTALLLNTPGTSKSQWLLPRLGVALLTVQIISNVIWLIPAHFRATPYLPEAQQVAQIVKPEDLVISGWDHVSTIYEAIYGTEGHVYNLPTAAGQRGKLVLGEIQQAAGEARTRGGQVYFLGILDQSEETWGAFLGQKRDVPYNLLDSYRHDARAVSEFRVEESKITLRRLEAATN